MRKLTVVACTLLAAGAAAENRAAVDHGPLPSLEQLVRARAADPRVREAEESRPLFFRVPGGSERSEVRFVVTLGSHPYLEETLRPTAAPRQELVVEFLARDPARLERLYRIAENKSVPLTVRVDVDGATVRELTFAELVAYNRALKGEGIQPVVTESKLRLLAPDPLGQAPGPRAAAAPRPDGPCEDQCYDDYVACEQQLCGPDPYPIPYLKSGEPDLPPCEYCYDEYQACLASCEPPPCTDPRSVTYYNTTELVAVDWLWLECFRRWSDPDPNPTYGDWYQFVQFTFKVTSYRRTEYCDGHVVIEVTGVSYTYGFCYYPLYWECFYPFWYPYATCF